MLMHDCTCTAWLHSITCTLDHRVRILPWLHCTGRPRKPLRTAEEPVTEVDACPQPACSVSQAGLAEQPARSSAAPVKRPRGTAATAHSS